MGQPDSGQRIRCGLQMAGGAASVQSDFAGAGKIQTIGNKADRNMMANAVGKNSHGHPDIVFHQRIGIQDGGGIQVQENDDLTAGCIIPLVDHILSGPGGRLPVHGVQRITGNIFPDAPERKDILIESCVCQIIAEDLFRHLPQLRHLQSPGADRQPGHLGIMDKLTAVSKKGRQRDGYFFDQVDAPFPAFDRMPPADFLPRGQTEILCYIDHICYRGVAVVIYGQSAAGLKGKDQDRQRPESPVGYFLQKDRLSFFGNPVMEKFQFHLQVPGAEIPVDQMYGEV